MVPPTVVFKPTEQSWMLVRWVVDNCYISASLMHVSPVSHPQDVPVLHVACQAGFGSGQHTTSDIMNLYISPFKGGKQQKLFCILPVCSIQHSTVNGNGCR